MQHTDIAGFLVIYLLLSAASLILNNISIAICQLDLSIVLITILQRFQNKKCQHPYKDNIVVILSKIDFSNTPKNAEF